MNCGSCRKAFSWTTAPLYCPCRGIHYGRTFPVVKRCVHLQRQLPSESFGAGPQRGLSTLASVELGISHVLHGVLVAPLLAAVAPPVLLVMAHQTYKKEVKRQNVRRKAKLMEQQNQAMSAELAHQRAQITMRCQTLGHPFVSGWCPQCGALETPTQ